MRWMSPYSNFSSSSGPTKWAEPPMSRAAELEPMMVTPPRSIGSVPAIASAALESARAAGAMAVARAVAQSRQLSWGSLDGRMEAPSGIDMQAKARTLNAMRTIRNTVYRNMGRHWNSPGTAHALPGYGLGGTAGWPLQKAAANWLR